MWNRTFFDFGEQSPNTTATTTFIYEGSEILSNTDFTVSCGCTSTSYDIETKTLTVGLKIPSSGIKTSTVSCKKTDTNFLLKATVK